MCSPAQVSGVFLYCLKDQSHLVVFVAVTDALVAVGVWLGIGDCDPVGGGMKFSAPFHVGPDAADKIGGGTVAQNVVFRDTGSQTGFKYM